MFATLTAVKVLLGNNYSDEELEAIIAGVNSKIERRLSRGLIVSETTDCFDVSQGSAFDLFYLYSYPVREVIELRVGGVATTDFHVNKRTGSIRLSGYVPHGVAVVEVDYIGGIAETAEAVRAALPELTYEANKQVVFEHKRLKNIASKSSALSESATEVYEPFVMREELVDAINVVRRKTFVV